MLKRRNPKDAVTGFTIAEALVVIVMVGILAAIAAPSWLALLDRQRVNTAQNQALQAMRSAQAKAIRQKQTWEVGFREEGDRLQWSVHIPSASPSYAWQDLLDGDSDTVKILDSNFSGQCTSEANYCVRFQDRGLLDEEWLTEQGTNDPIGQITFTTTNTEGPQRCVIVATILGSLRTAKNDDCQSTDDFQ